MCFTVWQEPMALGGEGWVTHDFIWGPHTISVAYASQCFLQLFKNLNPLLTHGSYKNQAVRFSLSKPVL